MATGGLDEVLDCRICLERLDTPKVLPCQHTSCLQCLRRWVGNSNVLVCPECRAEHRLPPSGVSGFPTNVTIQRLLAADTLPNVPLPTVRDRPANTTGQTNTNRGGVTSFAPVIEPTAPPLERPEAMNQTQQHRQEAVELQMALDRSAEDAQGIPENRNINAENDSRRRHGNQDNRNRYIAFRAVKLSSDCDIERRVAVYLFVKACFAVFFWTALIVWFLKEIVGKALDNPFVEAYLVIDALLSLCWLFVVYFTIKERGTAWIWGNFNNINSQCPERIHNWNGHFINFALFLTVVDYIGLVVFLFCSGYVICEKAEEIEYGED